MCKSGGGGDGGAAERKAAEDRRQLDAINRLNRTFGVEGQAVIPQRPIVRVLGKEYDMSHVPGYQDAVRQAEEAQAAINNEAAGTRAQREQLYGQFAQDARNLQLDDLGRERELAERETSFDLARRGLTGGSRDIDVDRDIGDQFNRGVLAAENNAQDVSNQARMADEKTRTNLIQGIRSGMSESDAISAALNGLRNNADQASTDARNRSVGGFFDAIRGAANQQQQTAAYEREFQKYRAGGGSGGGNYDGIVRKV